MISQLGWTPFCAAEVATPPCAESNHRAPIACLADLPSCSRRVRRWHGCVDVFCSKVRARQSAIAITAMPGNLIFLIYWLLGRPMEHETREQNWTPSLRFHLSSSLIHRTSKSVASDACIKRRRMRIAYNVAALPCQAICHASPSPDLPRLSRPSRKGIADHNAMLCATFRKCNDRCNSLTYGSQLLSLIASRVLVQENPSGLP
jgi:hypothetical protein